MYPALTPRRAATRRAWRLLLAGTLTALAAVNVPAASAAPPDHARGRAASTWVGTWATAPHGVPDSAVVILEDQTLRQVVHTSVAGDELRLRLTNEHGDTPLHLGEVRVALRAGRSGTDIDTATDRVVTFGGASSVTIPAGSPMLSDPVALRLPEDADVVVSMYLPGRTEVTTMNRKAFQQNVIADGDVADAFAVTPHATVNEWYFLSGLSVSTRRPHAGTVVAFGDSITVGSGTTVGANHRWPDLLAERLRESGAHKDLGVVNAGIGGNRLLHDPNPPAGHPAEAWAPWFGDSGLSRFERDVLTQPAVEHAVVLLGVNDLGHPGKDAPLSETVTADELIAGHRQLIDQARAHGVRIYGGTILPFAGDTLGFWSAENEAKRQAVNAWIRTSGEYDGVIDFDAVMGDPADPSRLDPRYDSGDHLHPNDAGMAAMAAAVPLHLFR